jgi:hypothetical protein
LKFGFLVLEKGVVDGNGVVWIIDGHGGEVIGGGNLLLGCLGRIDKSRHSDDT